MKIIKCNQNSDEWLKAKCGIPSSSHFSEIITMDMKQSKQRIKYMYRLAGECITKKPEESYQSGAMARGLELEDEARTLYEIMTEETIEKVGFCLSNTGEYGASPDGLVGKKGAIEIKCPMLATHVGYLLENRLPTEYFRQVQGQLLVTGREWVDFMSYYPGIKPLLIRVKPDIKFQKALKRELKQFCIELKQTVKKLQY